MAPVRGKGGGNLNCLKCLKNSLMKMVESDRSLILKRLNGGNYDKYVDCLFSIYHDINDLRVSLNPDLKTDLVVVGGMLYFVLVREAEYLGILSNIPSIVFENFKKYKTVDIDIQGQVTKVEYEEDDSSFQSDAQCVKNSFFSLMKDVYNKNTQEFSFINEILGSKKNDTGSCPWTREGFDLDFKVSPEQMAYVPQITTCIGQEKDHILEVLIYVNFDTPITSVYNLKCLKRSFVGESIVVSMTQQIFPNERSWRQINKTKSGQEIFSEMRQIFVDDPLQLVKFTQGFFRSFMIYLILERISNHSENSDHLFNLIIPDNIILSNKLFYFRSMLMRKIAPKSLQENAINLMTEIRKLEKNQKASVEHTLIFMKLLLDLWVHFNKEINNFSFEL